MIIYTEVTHKHHGWGGGGLGIYGTIKTTELVAIDVPAPSPVPEPGVWVTMAVGVLLVAWRQTKALTAEREVSNKPEKALRAYLKAGFGNSTDFVLQGAAYDMAVEALILAGAA